jgi:hypothetical protein
MPKQSNVENYKNLAQGSLTFVRVPDICNWTHYSHEQFHTSVKLQIYLVLILIQYFLFRNLSESCKTY